jgi:uncharacterized membrane protein
MRYTQILLAGLAICGVWLARCVVTRTFEHGFIPLNIFLAAVPLMLELPMLLAIKRLFGAYRRIAVLFLGSVWLLFLPNAFYILTDFMHLNPDVLVNRREDNFYHTVHYVRGDGLFIFDSLLIFAAVLFGAYVGGVALVHGYQYLLRIMHKTMAQAALALIIVLSAIGVYIGRFSRWNSWEGLLQPHAIVYDLLQDLSSSVKRERLVATVVTVIIFQVASFYYVRSLYQSKHTGHKHARHTSSKV